LIANISGTDQAIDKRKTALSTTILSTFDENNLVDFGPLTRKPPRPLTMTFNRVRAVVKIDVRAKYHQAECSGSWVIVLTEKKNSDENNHRVDSKNDVMVTNRYFSIIIIIIETSFLGRHQNKCQMNRSAYEW